MNFSHFIFKGNIEDLHIGANIKESNLNLENITEQEGDIPSLYQLSVNGKYFQITTLNDLVIGMSYDFEYEVDDYIPINFNEHEYSIGYKSNINDFIEFIKRVKQPFNLIDLVNSTEVEILKSGVSLKFINAGLSPNLCKAYIYDMSLYNKIRAKLFDE